MSSDLLGGMAVNKFWENRSQPGNSIPAWRNYAADLESRLLAAEENQMFRDVAREATDIVLEAALAALRAKDPSSPLLDKRLREQMRRRHIADTLATKGYQFDVVKGELVGKNR